KEQHISIEGSSGLSDAEIEKAKREAEEYAEADKKRLEGIEVRNIADNAVYTVKKQLGELGEQLPAEAKAQIEQSVTEVEEAMKSDDTDRIRAASDALQAKFAELASAAQQAGAGSTQSAANEEDHDGDDEPKRAKGDVVDAEFEEVTEEK